LFGCCTTSLYLPVPDHKPPAGITGTLIMPAHDICEAATVPLSAERRRLRELASKIGQPC
jgi:hypothetical protein